MYFQGGRLSPTANLMTNERLGKGADEWISFESLLLVKYERIYILR